jgi:hypothetical protein
MKKLFLTLTCSVLLLADYVLVQESEFSLEIRVLGIELKAILVKSDRLLRHAEPEIETGEKTI